jgi:hypothetical protein
MQYYAETKCDTLPPYGTLLTRRDFSRHLLTADDRSAAETRPPTSISESACGDYSEEAIPERDPAYRLPGGTDDGEPTIEAVSPEARRDLARRLQQLGMNCARAAFVASL